MKPWVLKYKCSTEEGDNEVLSFHLSEESAQREACYQIINISFPQLDSSDEDHQDAVVPFLSHVLNGNFALALQGYEKAIAKHDWDESIEIDQVEMKSSSDFPLMAVARREQQRWEPEKPVDAECEAVDEEE